MWRNSQLHAQFSTQSRSSLSIFDETQRRQKLQWPDEKFIWMQVGLHGYGQSICFTVFRLKYQSPTDSAIDCSVEEKHKDEKTRLCTEMFMKSQFHLVPIKKNIGFSYLIVDFRGIRGMPCFCHPRLAMRKTWNYE